MSSVRRKETANTARTRHVQVFTGDGEGDASDADVVVGARERTEITGRASPFPPRFSLPTAFAGRVSAPAGERRSSSDRYAPPPAPQSVGTFGPRVCRIKTFRQVNYRFVVTSESSKTCPARKGRNTNFKRQN